MRRAFCLSVAAAGLALLCGTASAITLADFGYDAVSQPATRAVLVIMPSYPGLVSTGTSLQWHQLIFDNVTSNSPPRFSVAQWLAENSNGRSTYTPASLPVQIAMAASDSYDAIAATLPPDAGDRAVNYLWIARIVKAVIDSGFNFPAFDANHDGRIDCPGELTLCIINPATEAIASVGGVNRGMAPSRDDAQTFSVEGQAIIVGHRVHFDTVLHEFGHSLGIPYELYSHVENLPAVNTGLTIMSATTYGSQGADLVFSSTWAPSRMHLDAYHKMRFGWSEPRIVSLRAGGRFVLPVATAGVADAPLVLYDPLRGTHEFFVLEYRSRAQVSANYDAYFAVIQAIVGEGLVIWQVATRPDHTPFVTTDSYQWVPGDPALAPPAYYSSSILNRSAPDLLATPNLPWAGNQTTPSLRWFDGTPMPARIRVLPFPAGATSITVEVLADYETWVDFTYGGPETGAFATPYNTLSEGVDLASWGGSVLLKPGSTSERRTIAKPLTLRAPFGPVTIGQ